MFTYLMPEASELAATKHLEPAPGGPALGAPPPAPGPAAVATAAGLEDDGERLRLEEALMANAESREATLARVEEAVRVSGVALPLVVRLAGVLRSPRLWVCVFEL